MRRNPAETDSFEDIAGQVLLHSRRKGCRARRWQKRLLHFLRGALALQGRCKFFVKISQVTQVIIGHVGRTNTTR